MAAPVGVQAGKQPIASYRLADAVKAGRRALLATEEHAGVLAGGVIHRYNQVPHLIGHPNVTLWAKASGREDILYRR